MIDLNTILEMLVQYITIGFVMLIALLLIYLVIKTYLHDKKIKKIRENLDKVMGYNEPGW